MTWQNKLLVRLSAQGFGTWAQFRSLVNAFAVDHAAPVTRGDTQDEEWQSSGGNFSIVHRVRFGLERLGHVEFFARGCENGWRVTPPAVSSLSRGGDVLGILCGARSPELLEQLNALPSPMRTFQSSHGETEAPQAIFLHTRDADQLAEIARLLNIRLQQNAPVEILTRLKPVPSVESRIRPGEFPHGVDWKACVFFEVAGSPGWRDIGREEGNRLSWGLFRFRHSFQRAKYFVRLYGKTYETDSADVVFGWLRKHSKSVITYHPDSRQLSISGYCKPRMLVERALVLCSGTLPIFDKKLRQLVYSDVPETVARLASRVLRQNLQ
jgi:hypothetical protein